jgi:PTH1 family peptidyl-tRNA hydrolase
MKLVVGLGNPGSEYVKTRHNVGYRVVDGLAERWQVTVSRERFSGLLGEGPISGVTGVLLKPTTFMNRSGRAVAAAWRFYKLAPVDVLVVADDMDLPLGRLRVRPGGSSGGHKGLGDIVMATGRDDFARLRVGIGRDPGREAIDYVLGRFEPDELPLADQALARAAEAVECWMVNGVAEAMNRYNGPCEDATD